MKPLRSIFSLFLAATVLMASVGVTKNMHLCAGEVQSTALFVKAQPCKMMQMRCALHKALPAKKCCDDKTVIIQTSATHAEISSVASLVPAFHFIGDIFPAFATDSSAAVVSNSYAPYKPPLQPRDIVVFVHALLI